MSLSSSLQLCIIIIKAGRRWTVDHDIMIRRLKTSYGLSGEDAAVVPDILDRPAPVCLKTEPDPRRHLRH